MSVVFKPRVLLSECLGVRPVRYDGNIVFDSFVEALKKHVEIFPICPEVGIGLGVPRNPLILREAGDKIDLVDTVSGAIYTENMEVYAEKILEKLEIDGALLKSSSPSCGVGDAKVYGVGRNVVGKRDGLFTTLLKQRLTCLPVESEKRLYSYSIRRSFLTKIFSLAELRTLTSRIESRDDIVAIHRRFKYLLMLYDQTSLKKLGKLVADRRKYALNELINTYREGFAKSLCRNPTRRAYVNVFIHIYSHLKKELNDDEKRYVLEMIEKYRAGRESVKTIIAYFKGFIYRFGEAYLAEQRFLNPYPEELDQIGLEPE